MKSQRYQKKACAAQSLDLLRASKLSAGNRFETYQNSSAPKKAVPTNVDP